MIVNQFRLKGINYLAPADNLINSTVAEFCYADTFSSAYAEFGHEKSLNCMIACLFRPARLLVNKLSVDYNGDDRQAFNEHNIEARAGMLAKLPANVKNAIHFNFMAIRLKMQADYPYVFQKEESNSNLTISTEKNEGGWLEIVESYIDDKTKLKEVENLNIHIFLRDLNRRIQENEKNKE